MTRLIPASNCPRPCQPERRRSLWPIWQLTRELTSIYDYRWHSTFSQRNMVKLNVSVVQAATAAFNLDDTLDKLDRLVKLAKTRDESQLCVFPEAFVGELAIVAVLLVIPSRFDRLGFGPLGGYPKHQTFGAPIGSRSAEGRDEFLAYYNAAVAIPSAATDRIGEIAKETGVFIVVGIIEKAGSTLYCSVSFFSPQDGLVYTRRKVSPPWTAVPLMPVIDTTP
jgi:hypothetical protein